jgi:hypothetical protein
MSILVLARILSLFDLIHFLIFFNIAGAPQIAMGAGKLTPCICGFVDNIRNTLCGPRYWCASRQNAHQCHVLFIINLNLK